MGERIKVNIQGNKYSSVEKDTATVETPMKTRLNIEEISNVSGNQSNSLVTKVSKESFHCKIVTPSSLDNSLVNKRASISRHRKAVVRKLTLPSVNEISDEEEPSSDEFKKNKNMHLSLAALCSVQKNTRKVYSLVNRMTGTIGGNGNGGAIYGELTIGSMQKVIELMKEHTNFNKSSRFIDVGCGLGKPNLHVAQDPGVEFSYGVEMERVRWLLGICNLNQVLDEALSQRSKEIIKSEDVIGHKCVIEHGDITDAEYLDPFTHVYMFDIGFPPKLFKKLAIMFNRSKSPYLICYHSPRVMINRYGFDVELVVQTQTSMHGSSEGHMGYIYKRVQCKGRNSLENKCPIISNYNMDGIPCDPMFVTAWQSSHRKLEDISMDVKKKVINSLSCSRSTRNRVVGPSI